MKHSESIGKIAAALVLAKSELEHVAKSKEVSITGKSKSGKDFTLRYNYADLASVIDACDAVLTKNGIAFLQPQLSVDNAVCVQTMLVHAESGEYIADDGVRINADMRDPKAVGSAITYARRYGLTSMVGIAQEDDDGKKATRQKPAPVVTAEPVHPRLEAMRERVKKLPKEQRDQVTAYMTANQIPAKNMTDAQIEEVEEAIEMAEVEAS